VQGRFARPERDGAAEQWDRFLGPGLREDNQPELVPRITMAGLHSDDLAKQPLGFRQPAPGPVAKGELEGGFDSHAEF
jgi:hypothetical protein